MTGLAASAASAAILLAAQAGSEGFASAWYVPAFTITAGLFAAMFHSKRLWRLLCGLLSGLVIGMFSSFSLLGQPVEGLFFMVAATMTFFTALCLVAGGFFEFVFFLHHLTHGRRPAEYGVPKGK